MCVSTVSECVCVCMLMLLLYIIVPLTVHACCYKWHRQISQEVKLSAVSFALTYHYVSPLHSHDHYVSLLHSQTTVSPFHSQITMCLLCNHRSLCVCAVAGVLPHNAQRAAASAAAAAATAPTAAAASTALAAPKAAPSLPAGEGTSTQHGAQASFVAEMGGTESGSQRVQSAGGGARGASADQGVNKMEMTRNGKRHKTGVCVCTSCMSARACARACV